jgi:predicted porin
VRTDSRRGPVAFNGSDANRYAIGYVHNLSRRTALYGTLARVTNKGGANFSLNGGTTGLAAGGSSTGAELGMRHSF